MTSEVYIENYRLDISSDLSSLLTFEIDNIRQFADRSTTWSKTIVLPGTANNNKLFGHIFQIGQANSYDSLLSNVGYNFNASKSADCIIFQNQIQTFIGVIRLLQINIYKGRLEYEVAVFGKMASLNVALSTGYLDQLDFSAYDHSYTVANILASWDNPGGSGYYYPLIDYGTYGVINGNAKHDWDVRTFRPALYAKEYIDKMFAAAGFRYQSDLFETERFKHLIIPHNSKDFKRPDTFKLNVSTTSLHYRDTDGFVFAIPFTSHAVLSDFTPNAPSTVFVYTGVNPLSGTVSVNLGGTFTKSMLNAFIAKLYINGSPVVTESFGFSQLSGGYSVYLTTTTILYPGDFIQVFVDFDGGGTWDLVIFGALLVHSLTDNLVDIELGNGVPMQLMIPKNIKQIDFLTSIVKLFNLYVYEDRFDPSLIYIKPYVDFYITNQSDAIDWTYKMNRDKVIKIKPLSEINSKTYNFKYKNDTDFYNDQYRKRYNQSYGSYVYDSQYEFATQENNLELIFAGTPLVGYAGEEKVYPTIFKRSADVEEVIDSVIRILQSKKITGVSSWDIKDGASVVHSGTDYGYAGHFNDPDAPADDLNFGALQELYFTLATGNLSVTQFNLYWSSYMAEITDKDSKLMTAWFYLTPLDISQLDFSKYIWLDGVLFRLNKISDYNASKPTDTLVELLKVGYTNYTESGGGVQPEVTYYLLWSDTDQIMLHQDADEKLTYA